MITATAATGAILAGTAAAHRDATNMATAVTGATWTAIGGAAMMTVTAAATAVLGREGLAATVIAATGTNARGAIMDTMAPAIMGAASAVHLCPGGIRTSADGAAGTTVGIGTTTKAGEFVAG
jgi:hypothetical protein